MIHLGLRVFTSLQHMSLPLTLCLVFGIFLAPYSVSWSAEPENSYGSSECRACDDPDSPYCLQIQEPGIYGESFRELYRLFQAPETDTIGAKQLQNLFKEPDDPCHRSDTVIANSVLKNHGSDCILHAKFNLIQRKAIPLKIVIPADLQASITKSRNAVHFKAIGLPILLVIGDPYLQSDWGGKVQEVSFTSSYARIPREKGCIQYSFKN